MFRVDRRISRSRFVYGRGVSSVFIRFLLGNFKYFLIFFLKSFLFFFCGICSLSVFRLYLVLDGVYRSIWVVFLNNSIR